MASVRYTVLDGEILSENRNGTEHDYVPDPLGSTVALLDATQTQTDTYSYWPYGELLNSTGTTATPFRHVGTRGYYQDNAGLTFKQYVRARYYDTFRYRWLTEDPIGYAGGDYNLYRYVKSNPVTLTDPSGLIFKLCTTPNWYKCIFWCIKNFGVFPLFCLEVWVPFLGWVYGICVCRRPIFRRLPPPE
jgi:RHS repeat-associated protein